MSVERKASKQKSAADDSVKSSVDLKNEEII
jgi:hypothetical protein